MCGGYNRLKPRVKQIEAALMVRVILAAIFLIMLTACGTNTPSLGLAPSKPLVQKAIALQISQTQQQINQQLQSSPLNFQVTQLRLKQLEPLFIEGLSTYHFRGTYTLKFEHSQQQNPFDIYLQRQKEGKTWRLLIPQNSNKDAIFKSYLIQ